MKNPAQQLADMATWLRNQFIDRQLQTMIQQANQPGLGEAERHQLLRRQQEHRQLKRQPIPPPG